MDLRGVVRRHEIAFWVPPVALAGTVPYWTINAFTKGRAAVSLDTWVDRAIPFTPQWEYVYAWFLLFAFLPLAVIRDPRLFRRVAFAYLSMYAIGNSIFLLFPTRIARTPVTGGSFLEWGIRLSHWLDGPYNCFPSMHVCGAVLAALCVLRTDPLVGGIAGTWALLIAASTLALKAHFLADVVAALVLALGLWALFVRGHRHKGTPRPRWVVAILPVAFTLAVAVLNLAWRAGVKVPAGRWE